MRRNHGMKRCWGTGQSHGLRVTLLRLFINYEGKLPFPALSSVNIRVTGKMASWALALMQREGHQIFSRLDQSV